MTDPPGQAGGDEPELPETSGLTALPALLGAGGLLVAAGGALVAVRRRRLPDV